MKAENINPFISSTINVFKTMIGLDVTKGDLYIKSDESLTYDVSGVIGIVGNVAGYVSISFPENLALKVSSAFLGDEITKINMDVTDAIGEVINMIAGSAKKHFADQGKKFNISVPNVVTGKGHTIQRPSNIICIGVKFNYDGKSFAVEVALKERENTN